ncbi:MAG: hypothetical protein HY782_01710 [Chloroflexi bacterium]|nr:hypothetical protein [Chloroflexota bacterium]
MHIVAVIIAAPEILRRIILAARKKFPRAFASPRGYKAEGADIRVTASLLRELARSDCEIVVVRVTAHAVRSYADVNALYIDAVAFAVASAWKLHPNIKPVLHRRYYQESLTRKITNRLLDEARRQGIALSADAIEQRAGGAQEYGLQIADAVAWSYTQARRGRLRTARLFELIRARVVAVIDYTGKQK